jgi:hypothetical protein
MKNYTDRFQIKLDLTPFDLPTPSLFETQSAEGDFLNTPENARRKACEKPTRTRPASPYRDSYDLEKSVAMRTVASPQLVAAFGDIASGDRRTVCNALRRLVKIAVETDTLNFVGDFTERDLRQTGKTRGELCASCAPRALLASFHALCDREGIQPASALRWLMIQAVENGTLALRRKV